MCDHRSNRSKLRLFVAAMAAAAALFGLAAPSYAQRGPDSAFAGLVGSWVGTGTITLASGAKENIRCRATYGLSDGGQLLKQTLRCASDSYNFDLRSNVKNDAGAISGSWRETTRQVQGSISGSAGPGQIQANIQGPTFSAGLLLASRGTRQTVTIRSQGSDLSEVSIVLNRGA